MGLGVDEPALAERERSILGGEPDGAKRGIDERRTRPVGRFARQTTFDKPAREQVGVVLRLQVDLHSGPVLGAWNPRLEHFPLEIASFTNLAGERSERDADDVLARQLRGHGCVHDRFVRRDAFHADRILEHGVNALRGFYLEPPGGVALFLGVLDIFDRTFKRFLFRCLPG